MSLYFECSKLLDETYPESETGSLSNNSGGENSLRRMRQKMATTTIKYAQGSEKIRPEDTVTRVMGCATMWHENSEEMIEMLKSIFRIDEDYSAR